MDDTYTQFRIFLEISGDVIQIICYNRTRKNRFSDAIEFHHYKKNWNLAVKILQNDHLLDSMSFLECAQGNWISKTYFPHVNRQNPNMNDSFTRKYLQILHIKCMHLSNLHGELKFSISPFIRIVSHHWNFPFDESKILSTWITIPQT